MGDTAAHADVFRALAYSSRNRSAACRIPMYSPSPKAKRVELRFPDPSCNGYLAFAAILMAGLDGIENKVDPGDPLDKDIYGMTPEELKNVPHVPASLEGALEALKAEINPVRLRPHPMEFALYYDA